MMVSVKSLAGLERRMEVSVPANRVEQEVDARLLKVSRSARIKGFRPGKAPIHVVRQQFGAQVREEVLTDIVRQTFAEAVQKEKLVPTAGPRIEPLAPATKGEDLKYAAVFEVYPEVKVAGVEGLEITRPTASVGEGDVDAMIESLRKQRPNFVAVERGCADGDRVTVDFEGRIDGTPFEGGKGDSFQFPLGGGRMLPAFEAGVRGAAPGETRTYNVDFPADYPAQNLRGKTAEFTVTVKAVEAAELPALDDEFCKAFGVTEGGVEALRTEVRENMRRELEQNIRGRVKGQVLDRLLAANPIELPRTLVESELRDMQMELARRTGARSARELPPREQLEPGARRRVALGLLLNELIRSNGLTVDQARVDARLDDMVAGFGDPDEARRQYLANEQTVRSLQMLVLEEQVVDWVLERAKVVEQPTSFREIMNFGADAAV